MSTSQQRIADAEKRSREIQAKIDREGGWVMQGLYHGSRRVRATHDSYNLCGWRLSPSEIDLIAALNNDKIQDNVNEVDLHKKFGLTIKYELAPVEITISEYGIIAIERTDIWGSEAKPWIDTAPWYQRLSEDWSIKSILIIIACLPAFITMPISDRVTCRTNKIIAISAFVGLMILVGPVSNYLGHLSTLIGAIYLCIGLSPFFHNGFQKSSL